MPISPRPLEPEVLNRLIELKKNNNDAYTELLSHIKWLELREDAMTKIIKSVVLCLEKSYPEALGQDWEQTKEHLRKAKILP